MATIKQNKKRVRHPRAFNSETAHPDDYVSIRDIAHHTGYSEGYLYNLRTKHQIDGVSFIDAAMETSRAVRFRWGAVKDWLNKRNHPSMQKKAKP